MVDFAILRDMDISSFTTKYRLAEIDKQLGDNYWSPVDVTYVNDWVLRAAAFKGDFHWHSHQDDEFFLVYKGTITIETRQGNIELHKGEGAVVPKGLEHKPYAAERAVVLMLEPKELKSVGD
jgi:mannose-6-phosphate isomerase-like protein (cupin superfamily)